VGQRALGGEQRVALGVPYRRGVDPGYLGGRRVGEQEPRAGIDQ
jgi:hypothetical protein